jgi:hypothetical protein
MEISIDYEYKAQNLIKSTEDSNLAIWKYDNHLHDTVLKNISVYYNFEEKFATDNIFIANKDYYVSVNSI